MGKRLAEVQHERLRAAIDAVEHLWRERQHGGEARLLDRHRYSARPPRDEYVLTGPGRDFLPVLAAFARSARHFGDETVSRLVDAGSGAPVEPVVIDRTTGRPIADMALRIEPPS